jgi:hypothetical protein
MPSQRLCSCGEVRTEGVLVPEWSKVAAGFVGQRCSHMHIAMHRTQVRHVVLAPLVFS